MKIKVFFIGVIGFCNTALIAQNIGVNTNTPANIFDIVNPPGYDFGYLQPILNVKYNNDPPEYQDVIAIKAQSRYFDNYTSYGIGGYFEGGHYGIHGKAISTMAGSYSGVLAEATGTSTTASYRGLDGRAFGSGKNYGVYGLAYGGTENWAGYFDGKVYIDDKLGVNTTAPGYAVHVKNDPYGSGFNVPIMLVEYEGDNHFVAVKGKSRTEDGRGVGGDFLGGYYGVKAIGQRGWAFTESYGLYAEVTGVTSTDYAIYGNATGGGDAWAGYFNHGNVYVKNKLSIGNATPNYSFEIEDGQAVSNLVSTASANGSVLVLRNETASPTYIGAINFSLPPGGATPGQIAYLASDNLVFRVNNSERLRINQNGLIGVGRSPITNKLEVEGNASKSSSGDWLANSDARLKKNIEPLEPREMIEKLLSLKGITYEWNDDKTGTQRPEGIQYGFTAQNIQAAFPTLVEEDGNGYLQTAYGTYDAMMVEAIRYLHDENQMLKKELEDIKEILKAVIADKDKEIRKEYMNIEQIGN